MLLETDLLLLQIATQHCAYYGEVSAYDQSTGEVTLTVPTEYYHWGAASTTSSDYDGIDIRAEVMILSRNIQVVGEDVESWGGQFLTGQYEEFDTDNNIV